MHVYKSYYPDTQGGVERLIQMLAHETALMGCHNRLITCTSTKNAYQDAQESLDIFYYPQTCVLASSPFSYQLWKAFPEHVQWADVIHYHFPWPMADILHSGWRVKKPSIVTYHSDIVRQRYLKYIYQPLMHYFLKKMDCIIATSDNYVKTSDVLQEYVSTTQVIPIGIDPAHYAILLEKQALWREKLPKDFILFVGVLRYYKGLTYLLKALERTSISLVIAGSGPLLATLRAQAAEKLQTQVVFTEALSDEDLCAVYSLAKMLVIPASHRSEAYCIALVEGLLFGLPLISTEIGTGTSFVNADKETGFVVPACDPDALKKAIVDLLNDKDLQQRMRKASRQRFETHFTAKVMAKTYVEVYHQITFY